MKIIVSRLHCVNICKKMANNPEKYTAYFEYRNTVHKPLYYVRKPQL